MEDNKEPVQEGSEIQIAETDNSFSFSKQQEFSHQALVFKAYSRVLDCLAKEMIEGFWENVIDKKTGRSKAILHNDSRLEAVECIKTLENCMYSDLKGTRQQQEIRNILHKLGERKIEIIKKQQEWWDSYGYDKQQGFKKLHPYFDPNSLYDRLPFYQDYVNLSVKYYRWVFEQLEECLAGLRYFKKSKNVLEGEGEDEN